MFKTCRIFKIDDNIQANDILQHIFQDDFTFKENGFENNNELINVGFCKFNDEQDFLLSNNFLGIKFKRQEKQIPQNHVAEKLKDKINQIKLKENRAVGKKEKSEIKEQIIDELLPYAFINTSYITFYFDLNNSLMYIDSTSEKKYEIPLSILLRAENFTLNPVHITSKQPFGSSMRDKIINNWFNSDDNTTELNIMDSCVIEFAATNESTPQISVKNLSLLSEDVINTLNKSERFVHSVSMSYGDNGFFTINENLDFKGVKFTQIKSKHNPNEETIEEFNNANLNISLQTMSKVLDDINFVLS